MSEIKYALTAGEFNVDATGAAFLNLTPTIPQGVDKTNRIGNKIQYRRMSLRFNAWLSADLGQINYFTRQIRIIMFQPRLPLSSPIVLGDFLDTPANYMSTILGTAVRVIMDKFVNVTPQLSANQLPTSVGRVFKKMTIRINNNVDFRSSINSIPLDVKDTYYICVLSDWLGQALVAYDLQGNWYSRLSYKDI